MPAGCSRWCPGKTLTALCSTGGDTPPFTLDEATQGTLEVRLQSGEVDYCMTSAGGELLEDRGALGRKSGPFKVKNAPAPENCEALVR